jgi:site-specific recombinase XerD
MGAFFCRPDPDGKPRWWLEVLGKGDTTRLVPATSELMAELARYRLECGLTALPSLGEETPLVLPIGQVRKPLTRAALHLIVKNVFRMAATELGTRGAQFAERAQRLAKASAHWLRYTAELDMANQDMDLRDICDNLGRESITATSPYGHIRDDQRHKETEAKHRIGW